MKKKHLATFLIFILLVQCFMGSVVFATDDNPVVAIHLANKVDVALAVGPTSVDYSSFEADLRAALATKPHPIPNEDLYITAAMAVSANTTSEFQWWAYDHTKPATMAAANGVSYGGVKNVSDATHAYIENDLGNTTTSSNQGTINRTPGSITYTPDASNPDIGYTRHPYQGIKAHMIESDNGATMDFYGYAHDSYKDFRYLPNDQKTKKVFEFAIQEDVAYDALDGVGFFFNLDITGSYEAKTQTMSGYLLFLGYNTSGKGANITIYKFQNVNTYRFHQSLNSTTASTTTAYTVANYTEGSGNKFVQVAQSTIYNATDIYRRIKLEVFPTYVKAYYKGSTTDSTVLTTPIAEAEAPINFTVGITGTNIPLDLNYISSYGFGPMASYLSHTCARPTHLALQNLTMVMDKVRTLPEVVREPDWHEDTMKFLVNLNEDKIEDFSSTSITAELLARLTTDDIYYIGWCTDTNAQESEEFLKKHNLKGSMVNIDEAETAAYTAQIQAIADEIYKRYWKGNAAEVVLVTDNVFLDVSPSTIKMDTADPEWPDGKWLIVHHPTDELGWDSGTEGLHPLSGMQMSDLEIQFNVPGEYDIYYRSVLINSVLAHRAPVAQFDVDLANPDDPLFANTSYDPDDRLNGIITEAAKWTWIDITDTDMLEPLDGIPNKIIQDHLYLITLTVTDKLGATTSTARQISIANDGSGGGTPVKNPPFAYFTLAPATIMKGVGNQSIAIIDGSYDLYGAPTVSNFVLTKDGGSDPYDGFTITGTGTYDVSGLPKGSYKVSLTVESENGTSQTMVRTFEIVVDEVAPTASASPANANVSGNTTATLSFSDSGGSGFYRQRVVVSNSTATPDTSASWTAYSSSVTRSVNINKTGDNYIHWVAFDNAGNEATGYFGPYSVSKIPTTVTLTASPATGQIYGAGMVTLTATLDTSTDEYDVGTKIFFYADDKVIGSAEIVRGGNMGAYTAYATITFTPSAAGDITYNAYFGGDNIHSACEDTLVYEISKASGATISVGSLSNMEYNGNAYPHVSFTVYYPESETTPSAQYSVSYQGINGTSYGPSNTPPTHAGSYKVTGTTANSNYETQTAFETFTITPLQLVLNLTVNTDDGNGGLDLVDQGDLQTGDNAVLKAVIGNALELPPGKIKFTVDGNLIEEVLITDTIVITELWANISAGEHDLKAEYVPHTTDNYSSGSASINGFSVSKANQSGFAFVDGASITKTYGNAGFTVLASGGQSDGNIIYELINGIDIVSFNPSTRTVSILSAGTATIRATKAGNANYNPVTANITITINKADNTLTANVADIRHGETIQPIITQNISNGMISYLYKGRGSTTYGLSSIPPTAVGTYTVTITSAETINYKTSSTVVNFSITPCDCVMNKVLFDGATMQIDYYLLQATERLSSNIQFAGCGNHDELFDIVFEFVGTPDGAEIITDGTSTKLTVNELAVGSTIPIRVTYTHIPTGISVSATANFVVIKGAAWDTGEAGYDKNTGDDLEVDISTYPGGDIIVIYNGKKLDENKDYFVDDGKIIFSHDFLSSLPAGESTIHITIDGNNLDLHTYINKGRLNVQVITDSRLPSISTSMNLEQLVTNQVDLDTIAEGYNVNVELIVSELKMVSDAEIIAGQAGDKVVGLLMDISLLKWTSNHDTPEYIKELLNKITIVIDLPEELRGHDEYWIAMIHHPLAGSTPQFNWISAKAINNGTQLEFEMDRFSTVAILFKDNATVNPVGPLGPGDKDNPHLPRTGDNTNLFIWIILLIVSAWGMLCTLVWRKRWQR